MVGKYIDGGLVKGTMKPYEQIKGTSVQVRHGPGRSPYDTSKDGDMDSSSPAWRTFNTASNQGINAVTTRHDEMGSGATDGLDVAITDTNISLPLTNAWSADSAFSLDCTGTYSMDTRNHEDSMKTNDGIVYTGMLDIDTRHAVGEGLAMSESVSSPDMTMSNLIPMIDVGVQYSSMPLDLGLEPNHPNELDFYDVFIQPSGSSGASYNNIMEQSGSQWLERLHLSGQALHQGHGIDSFTTSTEPELDTSGAGGYYTDRADTAMMETIYPPVSVSGISSEGDLHLFSPYDTGMPREDSSGASHVR
jgi:hypothetical protein